MHDSLAPELLPSLHLAELHIKKKKKKRNCVMCLHRRRPSSWSHELISISRLLFKRHPDALCSHLRQSRRTHTRASYPQALRGTALTTRTHTHTVHTPNFLKPTPTCLLRFKDLREFACQGGIVLDFIIQTCYSNALGQFVAY